LDKSIKRQIVFKILCDLCGWLNFYREKKMVETDTLDKEMAAYQAGPLDDVKMQEALINYDAGICARDDETDESMFRYTDDTTIRSGA
jgi:trehalose-6-phosphatase